MIAGHEACELPSEPLHSARMPALPSTWQMEEVPAVQNQPLLLYSLPGS